MTSKKSKICIIGAGPAGLTAAYKLSLANKDVHLYEYSSKVGGMSKTFKLWSQLVDLGPHRFFSNDPRINEFWLSVVKNKYSMVNRITRIYFNDKFFNYPLRPLNALLNLGLFNSFYCILSYVYFKLFPIKKRNDFESWVINRFGKKLYEIFFKTYSEKLWGIKCDKLDSDFASQRIKKLSLYEAVKNSFLPKKNNHKTLVDIFAYPNLGTGYVYDRLKNMIINNGGKIYLNQGIKFIKFKNNKHEVTTSKNITKTFDSVISTMPLTNLVKNLNNTPKYVIKNLNKLYFRNTILVYLQINQKKIFPDQWIYLHSKNLKVGRITNFSNWNLKKNKKTNNTILCMEYWCYDKDLIWKSNNNKISNLAIKEIYQTGLIKNNSVKNFKVVRIPKCYPVYFKNYKKNLKPVIKYLKKIKNLHIIGRYGSYKYNNQDHSILMGLLVAENITNNTKHDLWSINTDYEYQEKSEITKTGLKVN